MALPPLQYQITHATTILLVKLMLEGPAAHAQIEEVLKTDSAYQSGQTIQPDLKGFLLMGYQLAEQQLAIFFFSKDQLIEMLPLVDGKIHYGLGDSTIEQHLDLETFRSQIKSGN